jgi:NADH-dependant formate dehydrogenase delta subunit FdsD
VRDDRLVAMANQIAASVPVPAHAAEQTAAHLRTFWAPVMIDDLAALVQGSPELVTPAVREALAALRPEGASHG